MNFAHIMSLVALVVILGCIRLGVDALMGLDDLTKATWKLGVAGVLGLVASAMLGYYAAISLLTE